MSCCGAAALRASPRMPGHPRAAPRGGDDLADAADPRPVLGAKIFNT